MRPQRRSLVPLFTLVDKVARVKESMDYTLQISGAVVFLDNYADVSHSS